MTPSERERRIEAAGKAFRRGGWLGRSEIEEMLDAADEAVPVVPATWNGLLEHLDAMYPADVFSGESGDVGARLVVLARKLASAEVAARDFAEALRVLSTPPGVVSSCVVTFASDALARHPSFSGEEGAEP